MRGTCVTVWAAKEYGTRKSPEPSRVSVTVPSYHEARTCTAGWQFRRFVMALASTGIWSLAPLARLDAWATTAFGSMGTVSLAPWTMPWALATVSATFGVEGEEAASVVAA